MIVFLSIRNIENNISQEIMLPAIDIQNRLVFPRDAKKGSSYTCPQCKENLIVRAGMKNRKHFAFHKNSQCLYTAGGESAMHLAAKLLLVELLQNGEIIHFQRHCISCDTSVQNTLQLEANETIHPEYTLTYEGRIIRPDIVILNGKNRSKIIEIFHTHRQQNRPEPWFEFQAQDIFTQRDNLVDCREIKCNVCEPPLPHGIPFPCVECRSPTVSSLLNSKMVCLSCRIKSNKRTPYSRKK